MTAWAWRMLMRDWRAGELAVLGLALVLAVAALTSVGFLADRVRQGLVQESHQLLGGDLLLSADHPWSDEFRTEAAARGLRLAESASFPSMVSAGDGVQLAEIKAVSPGYPLRGTLRVAPALHGPDQETREVPVPGTVWLDERLATAVGSAAPLLRVGGLDAKVAAVLTLEPDRGINAFALAPRLLMNLADLPATNLIQPGSRVFWRLHLAGEIKAVEGYRRWAEPRLGRGERLESLDNARPEIRSLLERAQRFLKLAALLTVVLAAVAVGLAANRYMRRHLDGCAVMRCLGARQAQILAIHGGEFVIYGLMATTVGCLLGYGMQALLLAILKGVLADGLPAPSWQPWAQGAAVGAVLVVGFVLPPLLRLRRVPTLRVLRREWVGAEPGFLAAYGAGLGVLAALMLWIAGELRLGLIILGGFAVAVAAYAGLGRLLLVLAGGLRGGAGWRLGLANLRRRLAGTLVQAVALALALTALLLLTVARGDLLAAWQGRVPADAPNRFVINIQPDQRAAMTDFFVTRGLTPPLLEPMVRGRLVSVNGQPVGPASYQDERAQRLVEREFNLSWSAYLPSGNTVVAGRWHGKTKAPEFSVEQGLADTLKLQVGDELVYQIAGQRLAARITSLRKLEWDSMRVNFFVIAAPGVLDGLPASYITSFHLPPAQAGLVPVLVRTFPNLTVIDVAALVRQLQTTLDQVIGAVQVLFGFALLAGLVVLFAALQSTADERMQELAVMRALGARSRQLHSALIAEFAGLGAIAGLLAGNGAALIGWALARYGFHLPYTPGPDLVLSGVTAGVVAALTAGMWAARMGLARLPAEILRAGS